MESVRRQCVGLGEPDPADEATQLALKHHGLDGARLWTAGDDGFALVRDGELTLAVAPGARARGVGGALAAAVESTYSSSTPDSPAAKNCGLRPDSAGETGASAAVRPEVSGREVAGPTQAWSHADHPAARALAARHGWRATRELLVLRRSTALPLPELGVPDGVRIRGFRSEDQDEVVRVNAAAFADHPEQGAMDAAEFAERTGEEWFDPDGLLIAEDRDGTLLGFHWTKQHDAEHGEVYVVGIDPAAQGRGLGKALTLAGLHHLAGLGVAEILLYVEADNAPALAVYRGLGFEPSQVHVQYTREPAPSSDTATAGS